MKVLENRSRKPLKAVIDCCAGCGSKLELTVLDLHEYAVSMYNYNCAACGKTNYIAGPRFQ